MHLITAETIQFNNEVCVCVRFVVPCLSCSCVTQACNPPPNIQRRGVLHYSGVKLCQVFGC